MPLNQSILSLPPSYLFSEIAKRASAKKAQGSSIIPLGIGDVTEPLLPSIAEAMSACAEKMRDKIIGYQNEAGTPQLREQVAQFVSTEKRAIPPSWIHIQDGAKPLFARLLSIFGKNTHLASFTPAYPAFYDAAFSLLEEPTFTHIPPCEKTALDLLENHPPEVLILCSPNNPTGEVFEREFLQKLIVLARKKNFLILHDAAYRFFLEVSEHRGDRPASLYELDGSEEVVIEIGSLSKSHGFTGLRLGWAIIPHSLQIPSLAQNLARLFSSTFNGTCCIAQAAALAALEKKTLEQSKDIARAYLKRAQTLGHHFASKGWLIESAPFTPFVWMRPKDEMMQSKDSWELFDLLLDRYGIVATPGIGFGSKGQGYLRLSGFAQQDSIDLAMERVQDPL